ncbi:hypothetical protein ACHAXA_010988 [Cyclostephanos tholiformis]|uniref:SUF system FeS cluster assembly SufBD core domain-containing protein n=1 Tax=Cyclostephanos tholiformis TaxID=382380 RepID=A0ABD3RR73_9STRA
MRLLIRLGRFEEVAGLALYRLGMRDAAEDAYRELLLRPSKTTANGRRLDVENADKREEALPNALPNHITNHTPGVVADRVWLEDDADLRRLLEDGGGGDDIDGPTMTTTMTNVAATAMQNYNLAYNLATYLLITVLSLAQMCVDLDDNNVVALSSLSSSSSSPRPTLVNGYTQIYVGRDANITHTFLDESGGIVTPDVDMSDEEASALFTPSSVNNNGSTAPILLPRDIKSRRPALCNANFQAFDVHVVGDNGSYASTRTDMQTNIHHVAQGTSSQQEQRNMVGGRSTASFRGRISIKQSTQTDSKQLSRTVLLSDYARIWATPSLEIVADNVQCMHDATVSDLSEEELFYLRSRGLDMTTARNMLMYAFVEEIRGDVNTLIMGGFNDKNGLRKRIIRRLENVVPKREKKLVRGEFQSV